MGFDKLHLSMLRDVLETLMASPEHRHIVIAIADPKHLSNIVQVRSLFNVCLHCTGAQLF